MMAKELKGWVDLGSGCLVVNTDRFKRLFRKF